jgi:enoyl-CoA hydratase/carnithine racemase
VGVLDVSPIADGVAILTLNRPEKRNALSIELRDAISDALDALAGDEQLKVVVITGVGQVFSAGFDLAEFREPAPEFQRGLWASSDRFHRTCLTFPLPLVAAVNGPALAGGFDLAVMCDIRIAAETATFSHPEQTFGDVVYSPLRELVGGAVARDLCLTGRSITANEALALNLVSRVVASADLPAAVAEVTGAIARAPREILARTKAKALARARVSVEATLDL